MFKELFDMSVDSALEMIEELALRADVDQKKLQQTYDALMEKQEHMIEAGL